MGEYDLNTYQIHFGQSNEAPLFPDGDPRWQIRENYHDMLKARGLWIETANDLYPQRIAQNVEKFRNGIAGFDNEHTRAELYQSCRLAAVYAGRIYKLTSQIPFERARELYPLIQSFDTFSNFAKAYLQDVDPKKRAILRGEIAHYVLSFCYNPAIKNETLFVKDGAYFHDTGSSVLNRFVQKDHALFSPNELAKRGIVIRTGELVGNAPGFFSEVEKASVNGEIMRHPYEQYIYVTEVDPHSRVSMGDTYSVNGISWFNEYPVSFIISRDLRRQDNRQQRSIIQNEISESKSTFAGELQISQPIYDHSVIGVFVPEQYIQANTKSLSKMGIPIGSLERYSKWWGKRIFFDPNGHDAFNKK